MPRLIDPGEPPELTPPANIDLEMCVLGGIMIEPKAAFPIAQDLLTRDSFYLDGHGIIFQAMANLHARGIPPDSVAVLAELTARDQLSKVGGPGVVTGMLGCVATAANVEHHARMVAEKSQLRAMIHVFTEMIREAQRQERPAGELLELASDRLASLDNTSAQDMQSLSDIGRTYFDDLHQRAQLAEQLAAEGKPRRLLSGLSTGFPDLDRLLTGMKRKQLIVVAARPGRGKSAFAVNIANHLILEEQAPVALFSMEMGSDEIYDRLQVMNSQYNDAHGHIRGITSSQLAEADLTPGEWSRLRVTFNKLDSAPLFICDKGTLRLHDLRSRARAMVRKHAVKLVIVDYLQLMTPPNSRNSGNKVVDVTDIANGLKAMAQDFNVPVLALSQLSRAIETDKTRGRNPRPRLSDLRESGAIEQAANVVMFLHDPNPAPEEAHAARMLGDTPLLAQVDLLIEKQRSGPTGRVQLHWNKPLYKFVSAAW